LEKRLDQQRSFGLTDKDVRGARQSLGAAGAHGPTHEARQRLDDDLHDAEVVEHHHKAAEEDDRRQHLEGELKAEAGPRRLGIDEEVAAVCQIAEEESGAVIRQRQKTRDLVAERGEDDLSVNSVDDQPGGAEDHDQRPTQLTDLGLEPDPAADQTDKRGCASKPPQCRGNQQSEREADYRRRRRHHHGADDRRHLVPHQVLRQVYHQQRGERRHAEKAPVVLAQDDQCKDELQTEPPDNGPHADPSAVVGHRPGQPEEHHQADETEKLHASSFDRITLHCRGRYNATEGVVLD